MLKWGSDDWHDSAELKQVNLLNVEHESFFSRNCLECVQSLVIVIIFIVDQSCIDMLCPYRILCYQNRPKQTEFKLMHFCHIIKFHVERKSCDYSVHNAPCGASKFQ